MNKIFRVVTVNSGKTYWVEIEGVNSSDQGASATVKMYLIDKTDQVELTVDTNNAFDFTPDAAPIDGAITAVTLNLPTLVTTDDQITDGTTSIPSNLVVYIRFINPNEIEIGHLVINAGA